VNFKLVGRDFTPVVSSPHLHNPLLTFQEIRINYMLRGKHCGKIIAAFSFPDTLKQQFPIFFITHLQIPYPKRTDTNAAMRKKSYWGL